MEAHDIAATVGALGTRYFGQSLFLTLRSSLRIKQLTAFSVAEGLQPLCLVAEGDGESESRSAQLLAEQYQVQGYRGDDTLDFYLHSKEQDSDVFSRTPDQFADSEFRHCFYEQPQLGAEVVLCARVGPKWVYVSGYRDQKECGFKSEDLALVRQLSPLLINFLEKHAQLKELLSSQSCGSEKPCGSSQFTPQRRDELREEITAALLAEPEHLSKREADICAHIVLGYTTLGIGLRLGMSTNTVSTYRKRAYQKMNISSQNELFMKCLSINSTLGPLGR